MPPTILQSRVAMIAGLAIIAAVVLVTPAPASAQTGTIDFKVTNAVTGSPVAGASVSLVSSTGSFLGSFVTGAGGTVSASSVLPGTYFAFTSNSAGLVDEFFDDFRCTAGCSFQLAPSSTPIVVTPASVRPVAFALQPAGSIAGTVRDAGTGVPLPNVTLRAAILSGSQWQTVRNGFTNSAGAFTIAGLAPGSYQVFTDGGAPYVDEVFDNVPCHGRCDLSRDLGATVTVTSGATVTGRDFALAIGGQITGTVTDAATGTPLPQIGIDVSFVGPDGSSRRAGFAETDASGRYAVQGLSTGDYVAVTGNQAGYVDETFDNIPCLGNCGSNGAAKIPLTTGQTVTRNIGLAKGGTVAGIVRNAATSAPVAGVGVDVFARNTNDIAVVVGGALTDANGAYAVTGLPAGTYFAAVSRPVGLIGAIFPAIQCPGFCSSADTIFQGQPITVAAGATAAGRNFALTPAGQISGVITDTGTGAPAANVTVLAVTRVAGVARISTIVSTDADGVYTLTGLPGGTYFVHTENFQGLVDEVFPNVQCLNVCSAAFAADAGTPIVVTTGVTTSGRNLALSPGGRVTGTITDAATGARLSEIGVRLFANVGGSARSAGFATSDALGRFVVGRLPAGVYFAASNASNSTQLVNEIYDNLPCTTDTFCDTAAVVASGTPIQVAAGATVPERDFALQLRQQPPGAPRLFTANSSNFEARFTWQDPLSGGTPTSYRIEAGGAPGATAVTLPATGTSLAVPGAPAGRFFVRVRGVNAFGIGPPSGEVVLDITGNGASAPGAPRSLSAFMTGSRVIATWADPIASAPITGYRVEAGSATGLANIATLPVGTASFSFEPVPNGFYFLRVRAVNAAGVSAPSNEVLLNVGGVPSPPGRPSLSTPTVTGSTVSFSWTAPQSGPVTTYLIEAGSATGLANVVVFNTGNAATAISFSGVARGTYFVRVRAANGLGAGIPSTEVTVVVP